MNDKIKDCKKELEDAQENFRVAEAENEKLRVTNEIQNNLWKIWMEEHKEKKKETETNTSTRNDPHEKVQASENENTREVGEEVGEDEGEDEDVYEEIKAYLDNRRRGFRRVDPTKSSEPKTQKATAPNVSKTPTGPRPVHNNSNEQRQKRVGFCHFWNNVGSCSYRNCKFSHEQAPICKFDGQCNRMKCMFKHIKQNGAFLANGPDPNHHAPPPMWGEPSPAWGQRWNWGGPWNQNQNFQEQRMWQSQRNQ